MTALTILYIILTGIIALGVSFFFYYKSKQKGILRFALTAFRFLVLFAVLLLIINPEFTETSYTTRKPVLAIAVDNSASITNLEQESEVRELLKRFRESEILNERFDLDVYQFGFESNTMDSLDFDQTQTDIAKSLRTLNNIYRFSNYVPLLITDGNSTVGEDYRYVAESLDAKTFAVAVGDTATYEDLAVKQVNSNRYAYLKNEFPVEIMVQYTGEKATDAKVELLANNQVLRSKQISLSESDPTEAIQFYLNASTVGVNTYKALVTSNIPEKNQENNSKDFAVEVIDQKSKVLLVYGTLHPDLGALKKAIESNELREVELSPVASVNQELTEYDLVILFEPEASFRALYAELDKFQKNVITVIGENANIPFINQAQNSFELNFSRETDEVQPLVNTGFSAFAIGEMQFDNLPPLLSPFGGFTVNAPFETIFYKKIGQVNTDVPLLSILEKNDRRQVILLGTGIWRWRSQVFLDTGSFENFDDFVNRLVQFAALKDQRERLKLNYESFYYGSENLVLNASYFDRNYNPDVGKSLSITLKNTDTGEQRQLPLIATADRYRVNLSSLVPGTYDFTVKVASENISKSGSFTIIPFDAEKQFLSANWHQLQTMASATGGQVITPENWQSLIDTLTLDKSYVPIQKSTLKSVPLISLEILLFIIAACLAAEWFLRKYNGLI
ncbi:MAG: VWA domain-containing protein [Leeuwenhoekiella sp.]